MKAGKLLTLVLACAACGLGAKTPADRRDYQPAGAALAAAIGDFNGDGIPDIVSTGNDSPGTVSVLLGKGDGTFPVQPIVSAAGTYPSAFAIGDFNHDGKLDLVVVAGFGAAIMLGNGDGSFQAPQTIVTSNGSINYLEAIDINQDGNLDVLVSDGGLGTILVLLGTGKGTFGPPASLDYGADFVTGDFNGDGKTDIAVARLLYGDSFSILLGNGDGTFQPPIQVAGRGAPLAAGDLNGDGKLDLILNYNASSYSVLLGNGDGTFGQAMEVAYRAPSGTEALMPVLADLNHDGIPDLIVRQQYFGTAAACCSVSVFLGHGDGTFGPARNFEGSHSGSEAIFQVIATADLNGDGNLDLVLGGAVLFGQSCVSVLLGDGQGGFHEHLRHYSYAPTNQAPITASIATGDFNRDGAVDVAAVQQHAHTVSVLLGDGRGGLGPEHHYEAGSWPVAVAVGDFNQDGKPDLVTANNMGSDVTVMLGNGAGGFQAPIATAAGSSPSALTVADFNQDGKLDVAVANSGSNDIAVLLGNGDGTFGRRLVTAVGTAPNAIATGDFNGDAQPDLAVTNFQSQSVTILLGNGDGTFTVAGTLSLPAAPSAIAIADLNADGIPDLVVAVSFLGTGVSAAVNQVLTAAGNGDGTFQPWMSWRVEMGPTAIGVADFNLDGNPDLVTANYVASDISVLFGDGDGAFDPAVNLGADYFAAALAVADLDGDGKPDVIVANPLQGRLTTILNPTLTAGRPGR